MARFGGTDKSRVGIIRKLANRTSHRSTVGGPPLHATMLGRRRGSTTASEKLQIIVTVFRMYYMCPRLDSDREVHVSCGMSSRTPDQCHLPLLQHRTDINLIRKTTSALRMQIPICFCNIFGTDAFILVHVFDHFLGFRDVYDSVNDRMDYVHS